MVPKAFALLRLWTAKSHAPMLSTLKTVLLKCKNENWDSNCMEYSIEQYQRHEKGAFIEGY